MATASTIGSRFTAYNAELAANGLVENVEIGSVDYSAATVANKNFFLRLESKDSDVFNGQSEGTMLHFEAFILYVFPRSVSFGASQAATWDDLDKVERALLGLGTTRGEAVTVEKVELEQQSEDYHLARITFRVWYQRSTVE